MSETTLYVDPMVVYFVLGWLSIVGLVTLLTHCQAENNADDAASGADDETDTELEYTEVDHGRIVPNGTVSMGGHR